MSDEKPPNSGSGAPLMDLSLFDEDKRIRKKPMRPDWNHWLKMAAVSINDALLLSIDTEPRFVENQGFLNCGPIICAEYNQRYDVIKSALLCNKLPLLESNGPWFSTNNSFADRMVKLADFVEWAANVGYEMPEELRGTPDKRKPSFDDTKPAYLDETHPLDNEQPLSETKQENSPQEEWKTKNEREFLYRTIGALALLLIEKADRNKFGSRANPNKSAIYNAIGQLLADMGFKEDGQTRSTLNEVLKDALNIAMTPKGY